MRQIAIGSLLVAMLFLGPATGAFASSPTPPAGYTEMQTSAGATASAPAQDRPRREAKYTFSRTQTQRLHFLIFNLGPAAATAYCVTTAPNEVKAFCSIAVTLILTGVGPFEDPADDECYQIFARLAFPPTGARIVKC